MPIQTLKKGVEQIKLWQTVLALAGGLVGGGIAAGAGWQDLKGESARATLRLDAIEADRQDRGRLFDQWKGAMDERTKNTDERTKRIENKLDDLLKRQP